MTETVVRQCDHCSQTIPLNMRSYELRCVIVVREAGLKSQEKYIGKVDLCSENCLVSAVSQGVSQCE